MNTKAFDKKTAAFIGFLIQNIPELDDETMNNWMNNPDATKKFLSGLKPPEAIPVKPPLFSIVATINLGTVGGKKTKKFFTGPRWVYRDSDFDNWLPADQPKSAACIITTLALSRNWTFAEAAVALLGIIGIDVDSDVATIGNLLIKQGHTMTLAQAEGIVEKTERGEKTEMRTDGYGNFFFVETGDPKKPVSVGYVNRGERDWYAHIRRLGRDNSWDVGNRLLVRNLDASKRK